MANVVKKVTFPSPYGDMVLKCAGRRSRPILQRMVSVPLRGYGFEILELAYRKVLIL